MKTLKTLILFYSFTTIAIGQQDLVYCDCSPQFDRETDRDIHNPTDIPEFIQPKKDIVLIGETSEDQRLIKLWELNDFKLFPNMQKQYGDTIFIELSPLLIDSFEKNGIVSYRFRYKTQKKLRYVNSTGTYELYYHFLLIEDKIVPLWNKSMVKKEHVLKRNFHQLNKVFKENEILETFEMIK
jgi:hypothetical protein